MLPDIDRTSRTADSYRKSVQYAPYALRKKDITYGA